MKNLQDYIRESGIFQGQGLGFGVYEFRGLGVWGLGVYGFRVREHNT